MSTEEKLKQFAIKQRKKINDIENKIDFCKEHNFGWEVQFLEMKLKYMYRICIEFETEFDINL